MDSSSATLIKILHDRVDSLRSAGDLGEALNAASAAVERTQHSLGSDKESIDAFVTALELRGKVHFELGDYELACDDYHQAIDQLEGRSDCLAQIGRLHAGLGTAYESLGREDKAGAEWELAIHCFKTHEPPLMLDVAAITNNLAFLHKAAGNLEMAETHFLRALEVLYSQLGKDHEQTATVASNLGALYQTAGFIEQSRQMHEIALEARLKLLGEQHPDTAQSHNNLAMALLSMGEREWARSHFELALVNLEALGQEYHGDLEAVTSNYCSFLQQEGENQLSDAVAKRIKETIGSENY